MDVGSLVIPHAPTTKLAEPRKGPLHDPSPPAQTAPVPGTTDGEPRHACRVRSRVPAGAFPRECRCEVRRQSQSGTRDSKLAAAHHVTVVEEIGTNGSTTSHKGFGSSAAAITVTHYLAEEDQISEVLLHALIFWSPVLCSSDLLISCLINLLTS